MVYSIKFQDKMAPIFRADQVGSMIRPPTLLQGPRQRDNAYAERDPTDEERAKAVDDAINHVIQKQLELSIRPLSNGEYDRHIFCSGFHERLRGMQSFDALRLPEDFRPALPNLVGMQNMGFKVYGGVVATGKIRHHGESPLLASWDIFKRAVAPELWKECKVSMPSITWQHQHLAHGTAFTSEVYSSDREYFADLAAAYRQEFRLLYDSGLRSVQVDDPALTYFILDNFREALRADGVDPDELLQLYVWAHNEAIKDIPDDMHVGIHLCRGNLPNNIPGHEHFNADGSYERIAQVLFGQLKYNTLYLEFDTSRSGSFEPLRFVPKGTNVVLGLVSTKVPDLEDVDLLAGRVEEAAAVIAQGQGRGAEEVLADTLAVSPQCGFSSFKEARGVGSEENMWAKLVLVRDLARRVWSDAA